MRVVGVPSLSGVSSLSGASKGRPCRCGPNGRRGGRGQGDQVRAVADHEGQVEDVLVVDRVEGAAGEEGQVLAVEGEGGGVVLEAQRGRLGDRQVGGVGELELAQRARGRGATRPARPSRARRPARTRRRPRCGRPRGPRRSPVRRAGRGRRARRRRPGCRRGPWRAPRTRPSCPAASRRGVAPGARPVAGANSRASSPSASVTHTTHSSPSARKVRGQPGPDAGVAASARAGPARWVTQWTAPRTATALPRAVWSGGGGAEPAGGVHRERLPVGALAAEPDVQAARLGAVEVVEEPEFAGGRVDDPGAVAGRRAGRRTPSRGGVPAQVGAVGEGGVQRADALVVGEEGDPLPRPHGVLDVAVQLLVQPYELAVALAVDPQLARRTAPVPLPPGGLAAHGRGEQDRGRRRRGRRRRPGRTAGWCRVRRRAGPRGPSCGAGWPGRGW